MLLLCFYSSFALLLVVCSSGDAAESYRLRLLSYNIHHGVGVDGQLSLERIADVIVASQADIVALQEVDQRVGRSGEVDQPQALADLTKMHVAFGGNIDLQNGRYGNAILSRYPIISHRNISLPNVDEGEQRGVLVATIELPPPAGKLLVLGTHFDHRRGEEERIQSARAVNKLVSKEAGPVLLMGDLNDEIGSETLRLLEEVWQRGATKAFPTIPVANPQRQIDFILYRPVERWRAILTATLPEAIASDHRALLMELDLAEE